MIKAIRKAIKAAKIYFSRKGQTAPVTEKSLETTRMKDCEATVVVYEVKDNNAHMDNPQLYTRMCMDLDPAPSYVKDQQSSEDDDEGKKQDLC